MSIIDSFRPTLKKLYYIPAVQKLFIRVASIIYPPPYRHKKMEFKYGLWQGISSIHCVEGRQLGENNTDPRFFRENPPTVYRKGNIPGSRDGSYINITTLHTVMSHWDASAGLVEALRTHYLKYFNKKSNTLTLMDIYILSKTCVALPAYLTRRTNQPITDGKIPLIVATQYKIIAGVFMIVHRMIEQGESWLNTESTADAAFIYDYAEQHNLFLSPDNKACGGSKRKIIELIDMAINGSPTKPASLPAVQNSLEITGSLDPLFDYARNSVQLELSILLYRCKIATAFLATNLDTEIGSAIRQHIKNCSPNDLTIKGRTQAQSNIVKALMGVLTQNESSSFIDNDYKPSTQSSAGSNHDTTNTSLSVYKEAVSAYRYYLQTGRQFCEQKQAYINKTLNRHTNCGITLDEFAHKLNIVPHKALLREFGIDFNNE